MTNTGWPALLPEDKWRDYWISMAQVEFRAKNHQGMWRCLFRAYTPYEFCLP